MGVVSAGENGLNKVWDTKNTDGLFFRSVKKPVMKKNGKPVLNNGLKRFTKKEGDT
ncbi:MAG: hypothetical protein JWQ40_4156 [Segetibacter sp.]|nr:hypothetical protein [Segetibacter sp.]